MSAAHLGRVLETFEIACSPMSDGRPVLLLARALTSAGELGLKKLLGKIENLKLDSAAVSVMSLGSLAKRVLLLVELLQQANAKKALVDEFKVLVEFMSRHHAVDIHSFKSAVASASSHATTGTIPVDTKELVERYLSRLEIALGRDVEFQEVLQELTLDRRIKQAEAVTLAARFYAATPASTSRPKALARIRYRHEKLLENRSAAASISGKAA